MTLKSASVLLHFRNIFWISLTGEHLSNTTFCLTHFLIQYFDICTFTAKTVEL